MTTLIDPDVEKVLQSVIFPDLAKGRKDFDLPHTQAVVHWMKELLSTLHLSEAQSKILIAAAYSHDWGYIGLFDGLDSSDIAVVHKMKPLHMERGARMIAKLLAEKLTTFFTGEEIKQVAHLVRVHDKMEELVSEEEILLMEADTLGMLDVDRVKPTFSKEDNEIFIERELRGRRLPKFMHREAMEQASVLAQQRINFYE